MIGHWHTLQAAFYRELKIIVGSASYTSILIGAIPITAMLAWIASRSDNPTVLAYISVGASLMIIWNSSLMRMGWLVSEELFAGTLELNMVSRTPFMLVVFGKALAVSVFNILGGAVAFVTVLVVAQDLVEISNTPLLLTSLFFAMLALISAGFLFAPLFVVVGGRAGFFNAIVPFGVVCSGFLYPIAILPAGFEAFARLLPTSWAMDGVIRSVQGGGSHWTIIGDWGISLALTAAWLGLTYLLFRAVENRVRVTGVLGPY